tara:strand:- start:1026 stop:1286 length:261 start_codon:yes stop_codon:yes gene_type:complete
MIQINEDMRVFDFDKLQYTIQTRNLAKGEDRWVNVSYCTTAKSVADAVAEKLRSQEARKARLKITAEFDVSDAKAEIMKLPKKVGK